MTSKGWTHAKDSHTRSGKAIRHSLSAKGIKNKPVTMLHKTMDTKKLNEQFMQQFKADVKNTEAQRLKAQEELKQELLKDKEAVEAYEFEGSVIQIFPDENPENPRTEWDNLGHVVAFHKRYDLGDKDQTEKSESYDGWAELEKHLEEDKGAVVVLPLYLLDHSGITISTSDFHDHWDSGQVGYIYVTKDDIKKEYGSVTAANIAKAREVLQGEVKTFDDYLTGNVYGYKVTNLKTGKKDSVWGFFEDTKYIKSEAEAAAKSLAKER